MAGYAAAQPNGGGAVFQDLMHDVLPNMLFGSGRKAALSAFGTEIAPADRQLLSQARDPQYFTTNPLRLDGRIVDPLQRALEAPKESLTVILTDLFLSGTDMPETGASPLRRPLGRLLRDGRSVGIIGIMAPYKGRIHDLPLSPTSVNYEGVRPLFMLVVGPRDQVQAFHAELHRDFLSELPAEKQLFMLFSDAASALFAQPDWSAKASGPGVTPNPQMLGIGLPSTVPVVNLRPSQGATAITLPVKIHQPSVVGQPRLSGIDLRQTVYAYQERHDCATSWTQLTFPTLLAALSDMPGSPAPASARQLEIFGDADALRKFPGDRPLVLRLDVVGTAVDPKVGLNEALKGWSVNMAGSVQLAKEASSKHPPPVFPALQLERLVNALADASSEGFQPVPLTTIQIVFRRE